MSVLTVKIKRTSGCCEMTMTRVSPVYQNRIIQFMIDRSCLTRFLLNLNRTGVHKQSAHLSETPSTMSLTRFLSLSHPFQYSYKSGLDFLSYTPSAGRVTHPVRRVSVYCNKQIQRPLSTFIFISPVCVKTI